MDETLNQYGSRRWETRPLKRGGECSRDGDVLRDATVQRFRGEGPGCPGAAPRRTATVWCCHRRHRDAAPRRPAVEFNDNYCSVAVLRQHSSHRRGAAAAAVMGPAPWRIPLLTDLLTAVSAVVEVNINTVLCMPDIYWEWSVIQYV